VKKQTGDGLLKSDIVILERKVINSKNAESIIKAGNTTVLLQSVFCGKRQYTDILGDIIERKINMADIDENNQYDGRK